MTHLGYGITYKDKPRGIWPTTLSFARQSVKAFIEEGRKQGHDQNDYRIVTVHAGDGVPITEPAPILAKEIA